MSELLERLKRRSPEEYARSVVLFWTLPPETTVAQFRAAVEQLTSDKPRVVEIGGESYIAGYWPMDNGMGVQLRLPEVYD
jgi:hypothetical protein